MRIIGFAGPKYAGKDTAADYLMSENVRTGKNLFAKRSFAAPLKASLQHIFNLSLEEVEDPILKETPLNRWPFVEPRKLMQDTAKAIRAIYGGDVFANSWEGRIRGEPAACIIVPDLRHTEELDKFEALGGNLFYIQNDKAADALSEARSVNDPLASDVSESMHELLMRRAKTIIPNNGSLSELYQNVAKAVHTYIGDWNEWPAETTTLHKLRTGQQ